MAIVSVGIDLAKNVFAVHGVDESAKPALVRPPVCRALFLDNYRLDAFILINVEANVCRVIQCIQKSLRCAKLPWFFDRLSFHLSDLLF